MRTYTQQLKLIVLILKKVVFTDNEKFNIRFDSYLHAFTKKKLMNDSKTEKNIHKASCKSYAKSGVI